MSEFRSALTSTKFNAQSPAAHLVRCFHKSRPAATIVRGRRLAVLQAVDLRPSYPVSALLPPSAKIGDVVCFLRSCPVPFLMRRRYPEDSESLDSKVRSAATLGGAVPQTSKRKSGVVSDNEYLDGEEWDVKHFTLMGECFVEGLMYGKAHDMYKKQTYGRAELLVLH